MQLLKDAKAYLLRYHEGDEDFHQAVLEVVEDIAGFYKKNKDYSDYNLLERMIEPDRVLRFRITWEDDKGKIRVNRGWRVQFHNELGPYKGGLRFHPSVDESVLKFLGFEQCFKNALTGLPMGGGKGGSDFNPKGKSDREIMRFCQAFMQELYTYIGQDTDIPAGDIGVGTREISYLYGHYLKLTRQFTGTLTGKDPSFGGSCGREEATGYGCIYFLKEMMQAHDEELEGKRILISGAGNVALHAAEKAIQLGVKVLTLSDSDGMIYSKNGYNEEELQSIKTAKLEQDWSLKQWQEKNKKSATYYQKKSPWAIQADIAIPCATQNEIDKEAMQQLVENNIKVVVEGANMPVTKEAIEIVKKKNIMFGPAKAANAGGVAVSGLERTQNVQHLSWSLQKVEKKLCEIMHDIHQRITDEVNKENGIFPYKKGANIAGFKKLASAMVGYGIK